MDKDQEKEEDSDENLSSEINAMLEECKSNVDLMENDGIEEQNSCDQD